MRLPSDDLCIGYALGLVSADDEFQRPRFSAVSIGLDAAGDLCVFSSEETNLTVDVVGLLYASL